MNLKSFIAAIPDFPKAGIMFRDVSPLLASPAAFHASIEGLAEKFSGVTIDKIAGFDARGFIFGAALALKLSVPFVMLRKKGKLPGDTVSVAYGLEYGNASLEIKRDAIVPGEHVLFVDDLLATGGTACAGATLVESLGGIVVGFAFVIELADLNGRAKLAPHEVHALVVYDEVDDVVETADVIATYEGGLVLIERLGNPKGLAFPGGKVESGELPSATAVREFFEETGLTLTDVAEFGVYKGKDRDPRFHESMTTVFVGVASGVLRDEPGKTKVRVLSSHDVSELPSEAFAFDHHQILADYLNMV